MKVLEIGANVKPQAHLIPEFQGVEIVTLDVNPQWKPDILADASEIPEELYGQFIGVFASHVLEHFSFWTTTAILKMWVRCLVPGGSLHIVVPSLEWAARQILEEEKPSPALLPHLYAGQTNQWDLHYSGFTMRRLRVEFERAGLEVYRAKTGPYTIVVLGTEHQAEQHYIAGRLPGEERKIAKE